MSGTIGALDNGIGVVGVAPGARVWPVRVLNNAGSGSFSDIVCGIDFVTAHASEIEVASMSLGSSGSDSACGSNQDAMHEAICRSVAAGVTYVVAAGNNADNASGHVPAAYDEVITVSALADFNGQPGGGAAPTCRTDVDDTFANFSNFGADLIAPGVCILSTWKGSTYNTISGTSMATPHVSGAAEFAALCEFAVEVGVEYVLMNPLSSFGRGVKCKGRLAADESQMRAIQAVTARFAERGLDLVHIRFPNDDKPLGGCDAGKLIYVFVGGEVAVCPYLVFAARTPTSRYEDSDFLVGNILQGEVAEALDGYDFHRRFVVGLQRQVLELRPEQPVRQGVSGRCGGRWPLPWRGGPRAVPRAGRRAAAPDRPPTGVSGRFIAVEGPNGVGKTTVARLLAERLAATSTAGVHLTTEPSDTPLGRLLRRAETTLTGRALALAVAADRYAHVEGEIIPQLDTGRWVISDRYVQSSLVLQRIDGLKLDEIWLYNRFVLPSTISFYLADTPEVIRQRLAARAGLSRLELTGSPERELTLYDEAYAFLERHDWRQAKIDCHGRTQQHIVTGLLDHLDQLTT